MDKMKILMAASEAIPYMKTGGLADVVGSLPKYFDKDRYDVRVILPKYKCMDDKLLPQLKFVCHFYVNLNWRRQYVGIFTSQYDGVTYYFVDNEFYFAGDKPYNNIYEDVEKFAFFSKAVLEALPVIDFAPDVIHCNDWQTGLLPVFLKTVYGSDNFYAGIKTVFTIHNMKFQGRWKIKEVADVTGLPEHIFNSGELEFYGEANYLKGGIVYASSLPSVQYTQQYLKGDVLVSNIRPYFKKIWMADYDGGCSNDVLVFRAKDVCDPTFLYYVLANDVFFDYATATSKGTKMPRGDKTAIMQYDVPDFDLDTQLRIGKLLRSLDDRIATNKKINDNLAA